MLLARARSALARAARAPFLLPELVPPVEFASRIEPLPPGCSTIDNEVYEGGGGAATWHDEDALSQLATLRLLNGARIPYFDRIWRQQLHLTPDRHGQFLEVGCGGGIATGALAKLGYHMSGIDASPAAIAAARAHCEELHVQERTSFATGSAYDLSAYPDGSFDGVLMADVLEHLLDLPAALREAHRVLRPGGVFVFDTINRSYKSYVATIVLAQQVPKDEYGDPFSPACSDTHAPSPTPWVSFKERTTPFNDREPASSPSSKSATTFCRYSGWCRPTRTIVTVPSSATIVKKTLLTFCRYSGWCRPTRTIGVCT